MTRKYNIKSIIPLLGLAIALTFGSCSKWSDIENKAIDYPNMNEQNPELYKKYLESLKEYKTSNHKVTYAWFDNSIKQPTSRPHHINNVPDSIDVVVLNYPENLAPFELKDIKELRETKGTQVIYTVSLDAMKAKYKQMEEEREEALKEAEEGKEIEIPELKEYFAFMVDSIEHSLKLSTQFKYDGVILGYSGKSTLHMLPDEKEQYKQDEALFLGVFKSWLKLNEDKFLVFEGKPQNLLDKSILEDCKHIIIPTHSTTNNSAVTYNLTLASAEGVPTDRFIVTAQIPSINPNDIETGYWANGSVAVNSMALWCISSETPVAGLGILDVNTDYYSQPTTYFHTNEAINILNPSLK